MDIYTFLVIELFGSFWMAMFASMGMMYLIFIAGKVSQYTSLSFLTIFFMSMCLGYSSFYAILSVVLIMVTHIYAIPKLLNQAST